MSSGRNRHHRRPFGDSSEAHLRPDETTSGVSDGMGSPMGLRWVYDIDDFFPDSYSSVADPDPVFLVNRIRIQIRENTGSEFSNHKKTPFNSNFLVIKLSKIQFRPNNFISLILTPRHEL